MKWHRAAAGWLARGRSAWENPNRVTNANEAFLALASVVLSGALAAFVTWFVMGRGTRSRLQRHRFGQLSITLAVVGTLLGAAGLAIGPARSPPVQALNHPSEVALAPDGRTVLILDTEHDRLLALDPSGAATVVAGSGTRGFSGDGGPAVDAELNFPDGLAVGPQGGIYIADSGNHLVREVGSGVITTVAGVGVTEVRGLGDGGPATHAVIGYAEGIAVGPDGALFIADSDNNRIRRVLDGIITTVAGNGTAGFSGDGGPAVDAALNHPEAVAVAPDGTLYIADTFNSRVRVVGPDGTIATLVGGGTDTCSAAPTAVHLPMYCPQGLALGRSGRLYVADTYNQRVVTVDVDGKIHRVAGVTGQEGFSGDGGPASQADLAFPQGLLATPDGNLYIADSGNNEIRRVDPSGQITTVTARMTVRP